MNTDIATITKNQDVIIIRYKPNTVITEEEAKRIDQIHMTIASGKDMFIIVDLRDEGISIQNEAKDFFLHKGTMIPFTKAVAILGDLKGRGIIHKLLGRSKTWYEVKKFKSMDQAMNWFSILKQSEKDVA